MVPAAMVPPSRRDHRRWQISPPRARVPRRGGRIRLRRTRELAERRGVVRRPQLRRTPPQRPSFIRRR
eukprot:5579492-Pyramimonas_sp.AAC.1